MASSILINTNLFGEEDLNTFLECSEKIKNSGNRPSVRRVKIPVLTNEELFEGNSVDKKLMEKIDAEKSFLSKSASMEKLLKYFEEDVKVDSDQEKKSDGPIEEPLILPSQIKRIGGSANSIKNSKRVETAVKSDVTNKPSDIKAIRKQSSAPSGSYSMPGNEQLNPLRRYVKLSDLDLIDKNYSSEKTTEPSNAKKRDYKEYGFKSDVESILGEKPPYRMYRYLKPSDLNLTLKEWEERYFKITQGHYKPQDLNLTQEEWDARYFKLIAKSDDSSKEKYSSSDDKPSKCDKVIKPKKTVKSKVQKIAEMFNGMISQVRTKNGEESVGTYKKLSNELSPEPAPRPTQPPPQPSVRVATPIPSPMPSPKPRQKPSPNLTNRTINPTGCLVPEEVFSKLSVKNKALLFNKFMKEMSRKNPSFTIDPEELVSAVERNEQKKKESIPAEKQESVINLAKEIEAKIEFPKQTLSPTALGKVPSKKRPAPQPPTQTPTPVKEEKEDPLLVSSLTVVLKPSPNKADLPARTPVPRRKIASTTVVVCPSNKRANTQISSSIPIEAYAPPRKIRRTRPERSNSRRLTQNPNLEKLFYTWMKERHGLSFSIQSQQAPEENKDLKEQNVSLTALVPEPKEDVEEQNVSINTLEPEDSERTTETDTTLKNDDIDTEIEVLKEDSKQNKNEEPPNQEYVESDSSLMTMPSFKANTDESQTDQAKESPDGDFEFAKPVRPPRKKKVKRATLCWKKDASIVEKLPFSTTDSDSDVKQKIENQPQQKPKKPLPTLTDPTKAKKLVFKDSPPESPRNSLESDEAFLEFMNSPRKIRKAYTLTVMSSPSQKTDSLVSTKSETPVKPPRKSKSITQLPQEVDESKFDNEDQGFETSSTGCSPARINFKPASSTFTVKPELEKSPLFIKLSAELERRLSQVNQTPSAYSTPVKSNQSSNITKTTPAKKPYWHTAFSPVPSNNGRRRSLAESDGRRSSIMFDVIREEQQHQVQAFKPDSPDVEDDVFEAPVTPSTPSPTHEKKSSFWVSVDDLTLSMEISENPKERLDLLSNVFSQKNAETKMAHFGIDDLMYSPKDAVIKEDISKNLPKIDGVSHYWFASGDLAVPFQGNYVSPDRVKEIFTFIRDSNSNSKHKLSFGVDDVEFSKIPNPITAGPKFSIESSYSMLIGLSGKNGESTKFNWPSASCNSTPLKTSDFEFDSDNFEPSEIGRLSFSPYGNSFFDMASMQSERSSSASFASTTSPDMFSFAYENEPLDKIFGENNTTTTTTPSKRDTFVFGKISKDFKMPKPLPPTESMTIDTMIEKIHRQQDKLKNIETDMKTYATPSPNFYSSILDKYHGRPYVKKLHEIVRSIQIIAKSGFENCTAQQLESFLYFLSLYAETCLSSCSNQMNVILEQLRTNQGVQV